MTVGDMGGIARGDRRGERLVLSPLALASRRPELGWEEGWEEGWDEGAVGGRDDAAWCRALPPPLELGALV